MVKYLKIHKSRPLSLGVKIDRVTNDKTRGVEALISTADSSVKVCVIPTNEELAICRETVKLVG